ncbi:hypothetical protein H5410_022839 [Solanum commersonii]|uniref:Uncharacterized protein n=1 Tax=Solanum commersonii TaxID=4109 RepID=A0A9J5ZJR7_SOLCO|nr:hypothetical protein H5410_022839 [Solanum commersonii]
MNQSAILKKKGSNPNKAQSPLNNLDADMQYRSSAELVNTFKITREHVANKRNNKAKKEHDLNFLCTVQTSSKESVNSSVHVTGTTLGNGEGQHDIQDLLSFKQINHTIADVKYMSAPFIHEHNKGLDALEDQEEIGDDECVIDEEVDIDCSTKGILKQKKVRGKTTCKNIHARNLEEREEVIFDKGQAVGPTDKIASKFTNFIETIARNSRFINLMYTSWHAAVFGKEQPVQLRCYGKSVTTSSLKEDEETNKLKQKHANEINIPGVVGSNIVSPVDASSAQAVRGQNIPHSLGSTHDSVLPKSLLGSDIIFSLILSKSSSKRLDSSVGSWFRDYVPTSIFWGLGVV